MWALGADIGQARDPAALAAIELKAPEFHLRHVERVALGTSYPALADRIGAVHDALPLRPDGRRWDLVLDATGVGKPIYDSLAAAGRSPVGVIITGGESAQLGSDGLWRVPKAVLARSVATVLESGLLKIASALPFAAILATELQAFRATIGENGHARFEAGSGAHDDLVLAVALALWRLNCGIAVIVR